MILRPFLLAAALLALGASSSLQAQGLGRLFTTPEERANLDARRVSLANAPPTPEGTTDLQADPTGQGATAAPPPPPPPDVVLNGVVRRSGGRSTVWVNEVAQTEATAALLPRTGVGLRLSSGRQLILKPGQRYNPSEGVVHETGH